LENSTKALVISNPQRHSRTMAIQNAKHHPFGGIKANIAPAPPV
jgi:hypothetical protein